MSTERNPKYILFFDTLRVKIQYLCFPKLSNLLNVVGEDENMSHEDLCLLAKRKNVDIDGIFNLEALQLHHGQIMQALVNIDPVRKNQILDDIKNHTYYANGMEHWHITDIIKKYKLTPFDVFYSLVEGARPFMFGAYVHKDEKMSIDNIRIAFDERRDKRHQSYVNFDYWNGIGLKCCFPVDLYNKDTPFFLNMRRFNDRNNYTGYPRVINLFDNTIKIMSSEQSIIKKDSSDEIVKNNKKYGTMAFFVILMAFVVAIYLQFTHNLISG